MMLNLLLAATIAVGALGCETSEADKKGDTTPAETSAGETTATAEEPETSANDGETTGSAAAANDLEGLFGGYIAGATKVTVTQRQAMYGVDFGGTPRTAGKEWIDKFVAAMGPRQPGLEAVPKCLPGYTLVFANDTEELSTFSGVCSEKDAVYMVRGGAAYSADDPDTVRALLGELATAE
jgi:hypothetical protein